jgi:hypothetical protein
VNPGNGGSSGKSGKLETLASAVFRFFRYFRYLSGTPEHQIDHQERVVGPAALADGMIVATTGHLLSQ